MTDAVRDHDGIGGLYGPTSEAWRLNREAMLLLGAGPRALLLQLAHPLVAAGVADHSDFRADPWRRLRATLRSYLAIVYGTTKEARAEIRRLNELHRAIEGDGYRARDPGRRDDRPPPPRRADRRRCDAVSSAGTGGARARAEARDGRSHRSARGCGVGY